MRVWKQIGAAAICLAASFSARADLLPGMAEMSGTAAVPKTIPVVKVYAYNAAKKVGYAVFAVNGAYRAVNLFPAATRSRCARKACSSIRSRSRSLPAPMSKPISSRRSCRRARLCRCITYAEAKPEPYERCIRPVPAGRLPSAPASCATVSISCRARCSTRRAGHRPSTG